MKWLNVGVYCVTGVYTGLCALYVLAGYASGLPVARWSTALLSTWLAASAAVFLAGVMTPFGSKGASWVALVGASILGIFLVIGLAKVAADVLKSVQPESHFSVQFIRVLWGLLVPALLVVASWWLAIKTRGFVRQH